MAILTIRGKHVHLGTRAHLGKTRVHLGKRQILFALVGGTCFLAQYSALSALTAAGVDRPVANALGFVLAAQLNFLLSSLLTWRDRRASNAGTLWARLAAYNGTALISLAVNTAAFTLVYQRVGNLAAAAIGVACGMCVTYLICDLIIFRNGARHALRGRARHALGTRPAARGTRLVARQADSAGGAGER